MYRITLENGQVLEIDHLDGFSSNSDIVKIEKQVKNLTLEECWKLGGYIMINARVPNIVFDKTGDGYYNEDYIDITNIK